MQQLQQSKPSAGISLGIGLGMFLLPPTWGAWLLFFAPPALHAQSGWLSLGMVVPTTLLMGRTVARRQKISFGLACVGVATWLGWWFFMGLSIFWLPKLTGRLFTILFPLTLPPTLYSFWCHFHGKPVADIRSHWFRKYGALIIANIALGHLLWFAAVLPLGAQAFLLALGIVAGIEALQRLQGRD